MGQWTDFQKPKVGRDHNFSNPDLMRWVNEQDGRRYKSILLAFLKSRPHEMGQWTKIIVSETGRGYSFLKSRPHEMGQWTHCQWLCGLQDQALKSRPHEMGQWTSYLQCTKKERYSLSNPDLMRWVNEPLIASIDEEEIILSLKSRPHEMGQWTFERVLANAKLMVVLSNPDLMRWVNELEPSINCWFLNSNSQIPTSWDGSMNVITRQAQTAI